jgi:integrase
VDFETYRNHLRQKPTFKKTIRKVATINREMSCLHHLFAKAVEWEMSEQNPFDRGKTLLSKENNSRLRYLSEDEISRLLPACPPHLHDIVLCALNTGMRRGEILSLKWNQVRDGLIYLQHTKTDTPRQIPINNTLTNLFKSIQKKQKIGTEFVFTFSRKTKRKQEGNLTVINNETGDRVSEVKKSFATAMKNAKIHDCRFHDLRHTFASHMVMRGASLKELQEILGHTTMTMTLRYAHLSQEHKLKAVNLLDGLTAPNVTKCHIPSETKKKGAAVNG